MHREVHRDTHDIIKLILIILYLLSEEISHLEIKYNLGQLMTTRSSIISIPSVCPYCLITVSNILTLKLYPIIDIIC